jgi:DNA-binding CsgD family transcriptional regulator
MTQRESRAADPAFADWCESSAALDRLDVVRLSTARARAIEEASNSIARQLNGPLTALLLYMEELKQRSHRFSRDIGERDHLQKVVENALQQTERVCALVKQVGGGALAGAVVKPVTDGTTAARGDRSHKSSRTCAAMLSSDVVQKPLTRREREVLNLISQGHSNKQGALRMQISPRTFESHRAEVMRKLGARNTADLVRAVLLQPMD